MGRGECGGTVTEKLRSWLAAVMMRSRSEGGDELRSGGRGSGLVWSGTRLHSGTYMVREVAGGDDCWCWLRALPIGSCSALATSAEWPRRRRVCKAYIQCRVYV